LTALTEGDSSLRRHLKGHLEGLKSRAFELGQEHPSENRSRHNGFFDAVQGVIRNFANVLLDYDLSQMQPGP